MRINPKTKMTYAVCQHCQDAVLNDEPFAVHDGFSYHKKCNKCYVCNETNLQNAELFKGVIFCSSCSQRIFRGCCTARRMRSRHRNKRTRSTTKHNRKERYIHERRSNRRPAPIPPGIIELARMAASTDSEYITDNKHQNKDGKAPVTTAEVVLEVRKNIFDSISLQNFKNPKKTSTETGVTTEVTQRLLRQLKCPVIENRKCEAKVLSPEDTCVKALTKHWPTRKKNKRKISDMRIAELGASTEIANMPLRKHSEVPVLINSTEMAGKALRDQSRVPGVLSGSHVKRINDNKSLDLSALIQKSETSRDCDEEWLASSSSAEESTRRFWSDRHFYSLLTLPYKCFKRNIINRSSLIAVVQRRSKKNVLLKGLKLMLHESTVHHQDRGLRRLYSTINRRKIPYKMGWLNMMTKVSRIINQPPHPPQANSGAAEKFSQNYRVQRMPKHCKHFNRSHSYRCMRSQVMRRAGPTKSELAMYRMKIKGLFTPPLLKNLLNFNKPSSLISQACGSEPVSAK